MENTNNINQVEISSGEEKNVLFTQFDNLITSLNMLKTQINNINSEVRIIEKNVKREMKLLKKEQLKKKKGGHRKPSGFAKPVKISEELCEFIGLEKGVEMARTEVTKEIIKYIKKEGLSKSRKIEPDEKLGKLIGKLEEGEELTYFNMQKYMNKHFV